MNTSQAKSREYGADAMKGWAALHVNAPINLINGLTEPVRGLATLGGAYIPIIPRWEAMEKSEYWQAGNKGHAAEVAGTVTAGVLTGGATVLATTPGKVIATLEATYNIGVGAAGVDPTQHNREMLPLERTVRVVGGAVTATSVSKGLGGVASTSATTAAEVEAVTPEGVRMRVPMRERPSSINDPLQMKASEANEPHVARGWHPPYAEGTVARDIVLREARVFVRVHGEGPAGGKWIMRSEDVRGLTAQQIKDKFALPNLPKYVSEVHVPAGTHIRVGTVAPQEGWGKGLATQYELMEQIPNEVFKNRRLLSQ